MSGREEVRKMAEFDFAEEIKSEYLEEEYLEEEYLTDAMTAVRNKRRQLYYQLIQSMKKAESVDIIVSFLMESGVKMNSSGAGKFPETREPESRF